MINMKEFNMFLRFLIIGSIMTVINIYIFLFFIDCLSFHYLLSNVISFIISNLISYFINLNVTFNQIFIIKEQVSKVINFLLMRISILFFDVILLFILVDLMNFNQIVSKIVLTIFFTGINYVITKKIVGER